MEIREKIEQALNKHLDRPYISLDDDNGITGFVVSRTFEEKSSLDRQKLIDFALSHAPEPLLAKERKRVLMIAGITPAESDAIGASIQIRRLKTLPDGGIEVLLRGELSDAEYVRGAFKGLKGIEISEPEQGDRGNSMRFKVKGSPSQPLTKRVAIQTLSDIPYIALMPGV